MYATPSFISVGANRAYASVTVPCPQMIDFEGFAAGTIITSQLPNIEVKADGGSDDALIFDTNNPTGGDTDLETPTDEAPENLGKVLIISEDGDSSDPDDNAGGGSRYFKFTVPVSISTIKLLDIDSGEKVRIRMYTEAPIQASC